jgi:hypothetical protein
MGGVEEDLVIRKGDPIWQIIDQMAVWADVSRRQIVREIAILADQQVRHWLSEEEQYLYDNPRKSALKRTF